MRKFVFPAGASATEEELSEVDLPVHTLIGSSIERSIQKNECDKLFEESLKKDKQKDEELATLQSEVLTVHTKEDEALELQRIRKRRVPPEPTLADDHIVLSVRHARNGTMRRIFLASATMNNVYDWVGATSVEPMYFELFVDFRSPIPATDPANKYANTVLNMAEVSEPPFLDEEVTMPGFKENQTNDSDRLEKKRKSKRDSLYVASLNQEQISYVVDRYNIIEEMFNVFSKRVRQKFLSFTFKSEIAVGDGVSKDAYSTFFEEIYKQRCAGIDANVPTSLTETEAERFGTIISQAYIQHNVFPVRLAKAVFEYLIFDIVRDETLIESLLLYIHNREREIIRKCLDDASKVITYKDELWDILIDCEVSTPPNDRNFKELMIEAAKKQFIQKAFYIKKKNANWIGRFLERPCYKGNR